MRLPNIVEKIKDLVTFGGDLPRDVFLILIILLTGIGGFLIGRISQVDAFQSSKLQILGTAGVGNGHLDSSLSSNSGSIPPSQTSNSSVSNASKGVYVASRNGTVFHLPGCSGAKNIKDENKVWFNTKAEAIASGYKPASNCKGLLLSN